MTRPFRIWSVPLVALVPVGVAVSAEPKIPTTTRRPQHHHGRTEGPCRRRRLVLLQVLTRIHGRKTLLAGCAFEPLQHGVARGIALGCVPREAARNLHVQFVGSMERGVAGGHDTAEQVAAAGAIIR